MSTVTVVKKNGYAAIAADTQLSVGPMKLSAIYNRTASKIVRMGHSFLGMAGWLVTQQAVDHAFRTAVGQPGLANPTEIFEVFRVIHNRLKQEYFMLAQSDQGDPFESSQMHMVIANPHGIFSVSAMRTVIEHERFWAIGSGAPYALGAMHAAYDAGHSAAAIAKAGVHAAIAFDSATGAPVESHELAEWQPDPEVVQLERMFQT